MKKITILLLAMTLTLAANAQLTAKQVIQKTSAAMDPKKNIKGYIVTKILGKEVSVFYATDGANSYMSAGDGQQVVYNNGNVEYGYNKKNNTVTIKNEKFTNPFDLNLNEIDEDDYKHITLEHKNGEYTIIFKEGVNKATIVVDAKTFFAKSLKIKSLILSTSVTYKDLAYFTDRQSLIYNESKFPNAKIVDKRKK